MTTSGGKEAQHHNCPRMAPLFGKVGKSLLLLQPAASQFWPITSYCGVTRLEVGHKFLRSVKASQSQISLHQHPQRHRGNFNMASAPTQIGDFYVLPVSIPPLPSFPRTVVHHLYARRNTPKIPTADDVRSLFLTNLPVDGTDVHLRAIFAALVGNGRFESATFEDEGQNSSPIADARPVQAARLLAARGKKRKREDEEAERAREEAEARLPSTWTRSLHRSGGTAVVLFADEKSVNQVLKAIRKVSKTKKYPVWGGSDGRVADELPPLGSVWLKAHNRLSYPDKNQLQAAIDSFSELFAKREKEAAEIAKRLRNEPDEDGFVTVTRGGRNAPASRNEAEEAKRKMLEKQEKKKEEMNNFYRFQLREKKKEEQAELLKRFEEDKKKISAMREKRGNFVPES